MLRGMRKASSNWLGKIIMATVMGVLIISFGVWGIADIFKGFGQSTVAKVGRTEISLNEFRQIYTDRLRQITGPIGAGLEPPKAMLEVLTRFQNEQRAIEFVKLDAAQAGTIDAPSPEALAAYFEDHKVQFRAPEFRKIAFVVISPEEIGKWTQVSDDDAKKLFDQRKDRLGTPEKRQIHQIVFPTAAEAQAARERLAGGLSFEDLGKERGLSASDVDLGLVTKSSLDPANGDAVFALPAGEISQ